MLSYLGFERLVASEFPELVGQDLDDATQEWHLLSASTGGKVTLEGARTVLRRLSYELGRSCERPSLPHPVLQPQEGLEEGSFLGDLSDELEAAQRAA